MVRATRGGEQPSADDWKQAAADGSDHTTVSGVASITATLSAELLQQIIDAARDGVPNESVGLLVGQAYAGDGGRPSRYVALRNAAESPYRYYIDPQDLLQIVDIEDAGEVVWGIVHSHVASAATPSATDVGLAFYPDSLYLICSLADELPVVQAWTIRDGEVSEVPLAVA